MNIKGATSLKNKFPFRLGTTSYVIPADLVANGSFLADKVDDIELVLFESEEIKMHEERLPFLIGGRFSEQEELTPKGFSLL